MNRSKGFTLIELLVVIAIIALLMGILVPAIASARKQAQGTRCMGNQRTLIMAWSMYAADNNGKMVQGSTYKRPNDKEIPWVVGPLGTSHWSLTASLLPPVSNTATLSPLEKELIGIRMGQLYSYIKETKVYHCPADYRGKSSFAFSGNTLDLRCYRSYGIAGGLNGEPDNTWKNVAQIKNSGRKYVFIEEVDPRGFNQGSWYLNYSTKSAWVDPLAIWHNKRSTLSFVDSHVEMHNWKDRRTITWAEEILRTGSFYASHANSEDWQYMYEGYTCPAKP